MLAHSGILTVPHLLTVAGAAQVLEYFRTCFPFNCEVFTSLHLEAARIVADRPPSGAMSDRSNNSNSLAKHPVID